MVDWLLVWGVTQAAGFVFKPILEDLVKESAKDYTKDFFKDCLKKVIHLPEPDALKEASGKALKEFLQLVQQELEDSDFQEAQIKLYIQPLKMLIAQEAVAAELGRAFEADFRGLDTRSIAQAWQSLGEQREGLTLPEGFDWERVSKRYLRKAQAIAQESDKLRCVFAAAAQTQTVEQLGELVGVAPEFDLGRYAEGLREQYATVKLEALDTTGAYYNELKLWKIFVPQQVRECQEFLPQVYEIPKEHLLRLRVAGEMSEVEIAEAEIERYRRVYGEQSMRSVLEVVDNPNNGGGNRAEQYAVILGDPGSGKSTLLQYLALVWAERPVRELALHPIPLLIELRSYGRDKQEKGCTDLLSFVHGGNVTCRLNQRDLHEKLKAGQAIALFDGIDEVFDPALREEVVRDIHRFTNDYPLVRSVVTSRWLGYEAHTLRGAGFRHFMLQDLEPEQVEEFICKWHELMFVGGADQVRKRERLQRAIRESKAIRELAGNPLLLTMMAILNRNRELPRDRPALYEQASQVLLHQWDVERNLIETRVDPLAIDYKDKQVILRRVERHMQSGEKGLAGNIISTADLERILMEYLRSIDVGEPRVVARAMIQQLRSRNFILCYLGAESYAFVHRTFLEYFCAWDIVCQFQEKQTLGIEELKTDVFGRHWKDESWQEVLCLIAGMIEARFTGNVIEFLMGLDGEEDEFANLFLAAKCLLEVRHRVEVVGVDQQLLKRMKTLSTYDLDYYYEYEDNEETSLVIRIRTQAVSTIAITWQKDQSTFTWLKSCSQFDEDINVQDVALREIARGWQDNPNTLLWLKVCAQSREYSFLSSVAIQELARGWKDDPDTLSIVKTHAQSSKSSSTAMRELARGWKDDPDTLPLVKSRVHSGNENNMRNAAIEELAQGWKDEPGIFEFLYKLATHAPYEQTSQWDENPRQTALEAIIKHYPRQPQTLKLLRNRAQIDRDSNVRCLAIQKLAYNWKDEPNTLAIVQAYAQSDKNYSVRSAAVKELARGWKDEPNTLSIVKTSAQLDNHNFVRKTAVEELTQKWKDEPGMFQFLYDRALHDPFVQKRHKFGGEPNPRQTALEAIAKNYPNHAQTLTLLRDRSQHDDDYIVRSVAVRILAQGWKDEPGMLEILLERAFNDPNANSRKASLEAIVKAYPHHLQTLALLRDRAHNDDDNAVRMAAVEALACGWKDDSHTLSMLKTFARSDADNHVRMVSIEKLARGWKDDPDTLLMLKIFVQSDDDNGVRSAAVEELVRGWKDEPEMLEILFDCVFSALLASEKDELYGFLQTVLAAISKNYSHKLQTLVFWHDCLQNYADDPYIQSVAKQELIKLGQPVPRF